MYFCTNSYWYKAEKYAINEEPIGIGYYTNEAS
jgi:hypothetical protein